jgi:hypothetical protein
MENPILDGSLRSYSFHLSENVQFLSFGGDPTETVSTDIESYDNIDMMSSIVYQCEGQTKKMVWMDSSIHFVKGELVDGEWMMPFIPQMFICQGSGRYDLLFELVEKNDNIYVMIYPNI